MDSSSPVPEPAARFLTFNSVIRVNQIEVGRDRVLGQDERSLHTPAAVEALRTAFHAGMPDGRMTWALSWLALHDESPAYRDIRALLRRWARDYGDEVTFIPGGFFANAYNSRAQVDQDLADGLTQLRRIMGDGYQPTSVIAGFLSAANQRTLAERHGIHVCQGNIWSQFAIDNQDGDGSICYPYYPSREHFCKPAQGTDDLVACVNLDGWTCDFLAARREGFADGFNSRLGVGPIETLGAFDEETALRQMLATAATHYDGGVRLNGWGWVTDCWEVALVGQLGRLHVLTAWLRELRRRWPDLQCPTLGAFGLRWRAKHPDNRDLLYRFIQRGTGIGGSDAHLEIRWLMSRSCRLALLRDWRRQTPFQVIDFTDYRLPACEPQNLTRRWSLLGEINQKQSRPQDQPRALMDCPASWRELARPLLEGMQTEAGEKLG